MIKPFARCKALLLACFCWVLGMPATGAESDRPNFIIIYADDLGYRDLDKSYTPNLNQMAAEGIRFDNFYVSSPVCSASRAALLTGSYHTRTGVREVFIPNSKSGLGEGETTIAELLAGQGYISGIVGKWHLGDHPEALPRKHGFAYYFGIPYSNDMFNIPSIPGREALPLLRNERVVELDPDMRYMTRRYTEEALAFIDRHAGQPFFLYFSHTFPHKPLYVSPAFEGVSASGLYGDVIAEIDWSVGQVLNKLKALELDQKTLVIFTSDNGPWRIYGNHAGDCGDLRGQKTVVFDCGVRVPFIARWGNRIAGASVSDELGSTIDLLPTLAALAHASLPASKIDGVDISPALLGAVDELQDRALFFYFRGQLQAMRWKNWKLHFPHEYRRLVALGSDGVRGQDEPARIGLELYDLDIDAAESVDVAASHPDIVETMQALAASERLQLGDALLDQAGAEIREPAQYAYSWTQRLEWLLQRLLQRPVNLGDSGLMLWIVPLLLVLALLLLSAWWWRSRGRT